MPKLHLLCNVTTASRYQGPQQILRPGIQALSPAGNYAAEYVVFAHAGRGRIHAGRAARQNSMLPAPPAGNPREPIALGHGADRFETEWQVRRVVGRNENFAWNRHLTKLRNCCCGVFILSDIGGLTWSDPDCPNCKT